MTRQLRMATPSWRDSSGLCAYSDGDRHLGHIVRTSEGWMAFDGTHINVQCNAFRLLGFFCSVATAKEAVQAATCPASSRPFQVNPV